MRTPTRSAFAAAAFVAGLLAPLLGEVTPAAAAMVTTEAELRAAFGNAAETTIDLANDITLSDCAAGDVDRSSATNLTLNGHGFTITQTCPGERVLETAGGGGLTLNGVTVTGGDGAGAESTGGGVFAAGSLIIQGSAIVDNSAGPDGLAAGLFGQAVTISNSRISGNTAEAGTFGGLGGAMASSGPIQITDSTISGNRSEGGPSIFSGQAAAIFTNNAVTITRSTLNGNVAEASTGGSGGNGGAISTNGAVTLVNSTVTANEAQGANGNNGGVGSNELTLVYSTIVGNSAANSANVSGTARTVFATVVARPFGGGQNCSTGTVTSNGYNFSDDASCGFTNTAQGDRQSAGDPLLGALAGNGGPTQTMLPEAGSPLIDAIPIVACQGDGAIGVSTDQRGVSRPQQAGCDIGAVEVAVEEAVPSGPVPAGPTPAVPVTGVVVRFTG